MMSETFLVHTNYSTRKKFVFQYPELDNLVEELGEKEAREQVKSYLPRVLDNTAERCECSMVSSHDKARYLRELDHIEKAGKSYLAGTGTIVVFCGDYSSKNNKDKTVFRFRRK